MLRIHFTFADLAALRIADQVDRGAEVVFSLHVMCARPRDLRFHRWLRATRRSRATTVLSELYAPALLPAFLSTAVEPEWQGTVAGTLASDPDDRRTHLRHLASFRPITPFARALADDDAEARDLVADALGSYQKTALEPWLPQITSLADAERHKWARLAAGGPGHLLDQLHPLLTWLPPVLHIASKVDADIHLDGRGLLIQPTVFGAGRPWVGHFGSTHRQPVLFVPLPQQPPLGDHEPDTPKTLIPLLGRTRASVLDLIAATGPCGTGEIARRLDCSPTSVSEHTAVLRDSGLITTVRAGQSVRHTVTDLGTALVRRQGG